MNNMRKLKILNRKVVKQGDSHYIYIPKAYFDNGQLNINEKYDVIIIPQRKEDISLNNHEETIKTPQ